jgi:hypothetical protein
MANRLLGMAYPIDPGEVTGGAGTFGLDCAAGDVTIDRGRMLATGIFATNARDRVGDILEIDGIDTASHRQNPIALWDHGKNPHLSFPIGRHKSDDGQYLVQLDPDNGLAIATTRFSQTLHEAEQIFGLIDEKIVGGQSIGYREIKAPPIDATRPKGGKHLIAVELVEISWCAAPVNAEAVGGYAELVRKALDRNRICGKSLAPSLRLSLEPLAARCSIWAPGWTLPGKAIATADDGIAEPDGREPLIDRLADLIDEIGDDGATEVMGKAWAEWDHPRDASGKFTEDGSEHAQSRIAAKVKETVNGPARKMRNQRLADRLAGLTVKQLQDKVALAEKVADRLKNGGHEKIEQDASASHQKGREAMAVSKLAKLEPANHRQAADTHEAVVAHHQKLSDDAWKNGDYAAAEHHEHSAYLHQQMAEMHRGLADDLDKLPKPEAPKVEAPKVDAKPAETPAAPPEKPAEQSPAMQQLLAEVKPGEMWPGENGRKLVADDVPAKPEAKPAEAKPSDPVADIGKQLTDMHADPSKFEFADIDKIETKLNDLTARQALDVAKGFGLPLPIGTGKRAAIESIRTKLQERKIAETTTTTTSKPSWIPPGSRRATAYGKSLWPTDGIFAGKSIEPEGV